MIDVSLDAGINLIDSSNSYAKGECEKIIGRALARNKRRNQVILATKFHYPTGDGPNDRGNSRLHIMRACEDSLRRLQTDHIDLYQAHRPDFQVPIDETLGALSDLIRQGKVVYIGSSTAPAWKVMESILVSDMKGYSRIISEQPPYNLLDRRIENELVPMCQEYGIGLLTWSPLAMGMLAARYQDDQPYPEDSRSGLRGGIYAERVTARAVRVGNQFAKLAVSNGFSPAQLAVLWVKDQPGITAPIIGPRTIAQLEHLIPVSDMNLDADLKIMCDELVPPGSAVANFHNTAPWMKMKLI
jgi:aryl-alcohol dehydrogenase-like predicted oxidoreductase